jgi:hypothetical protein
LVGEVGFLATWWVGLFAGWFIGRVAVPALPRGAVPRYCATAFAIVFAFAALGMLTGYALGRMHGNDFSAWGPIAYPLNVEKLAAFVRVAYIHNTSYGGGLIGLVVAVIYVRRVAKPHCKQN